MSTTTERPNDGPEYEGSSEAPAPSAARAPRLIQNDSTTEIPVHLLFRDGTGPGARLPGLSGPATPGTAPTASISGSAAGAGGCTTTGTTDPGTPLAPAVVGRRRGTGEQPRTVSPASGPHRPVLGAPPRPEPPSDTGPVELRARSWPGAAAVAAGATGLAGCAAGAWWSGVLPPLAVSLARLPVPPDGAQLGPAQWAVMAGSGALSLFAFGGLGRGRVGRAWVLSLFGRYRGSVRRTGLVWVNPLLKRRRVDVRLRHWRSEPMPVVDAHGVALSVVVLVVWRVRDTARAALAVEDHAAYLRACVESGLARVMSRLPADPSACGAAGPTLRDTEAVGNALTRRLAADAAPAGIEVFSVQPTRIEYAPEVADAMRRRGLAALDARERDSVLTRVVDSVEDTVTRLTTRGLVELDDYERKALVKDLTVAFYTGQTER
ncbi:SPFH domain-containing protein [Streptomyces sp. NPDC002851]